MARFKKVFFIISLCWSTISGYFSYKYLINLESNLITKAKQIAQEKFQAQLSIKSLKLISINPLGIAIEDLVIDKKNEYKIFLPWTEIKILNTINILQFKTQVLQLQIESLNYNTDVMLNETSKEIAKNKRDEHTKETDSNAIKNTKDFLPKNPFVKNIALLLNLRNGNVNVSKDKSTLFKASNEKISVSIPSLEAPINIELLSSINIPNSYFSFDIPIRLNSELTFSNEWLSSTKTQLQVFALDTKNEFKFHLGKKFLNFSSKAKINNLALIPFSEFKNSPIKKLEGELISSFETSGYLNELPYLKGSLEFKKLKADMTMKSPELSIQGEFSGNLKADFTYQQKLFFNNFNWDLDLTPLYIQKKDIFKKPSSIVLTSQAKGRYQDGVYFDFFKLKLDSFFIQSQGYLSFDNPSRFQFEIPKFSFSHFEKFFPSLPQYPLNGELQTNGEVKGLIKDPKNLEIKLDPIKIDQFKYTVRNTINDVTLEGPITGKLFGSIHIKNQLAQKGEVVGSINAMNINISKEGNSLKVEDEPLKLDFKTSVLNNKINIDSFKINSFIADLNIKGTPPLSLDDQFSFKIDISHLNWNRIKHFLPKNELISSIKNLTGEVQSTLYGKLNKSNLSASGLSINAESKLSIEELTLPWDLSFKNPDATPKSETLASNNAKAFLPRFSIFEKSKITNQLRISKLIFYNKDFFSNLEFNSLLQKNQLQLTGKIEKIFNGGLNINRLIIPLTVDDPEISFRINSQKIEALPLMSLFLPDIKNLIKGQAQLNIEGTTKLPSSPKFKDSFQAKGQFQYNQGRLETLQIMNLVKEKLLSLPQVSLPKKFDKSPIEGQIDIDFEITHQLLNLIQFQATTTRKEQITLSGHIDSSLMSELSGTLKLSDVPLKGDFIKANQDELGRLNFPLSLKGNLRNLSWDFTGNILQKMTQKYIDAEKNNLTLIAKKEFEQKKQEAQRMIQNEAQKQTHKLKENAKKEIQNWFK
ncbi:MAG: hypothetical protein L6Q37_11960 [Bdellovibrionaceae bacterium]|nr:hypothetical protein [Pseudobdellovibrionaceae bacterium]NUM58684.1 hypothetical protein [Pseudobdellovibrionaceae bacterium]